MRVRILFRDYEVSDINKQQLLYGVAVLICILSVFGVIFFLSYYSETPSEANFPSPTPGVFSALTEAEKQRAAQQIKGAQIQASLRPLPSSGPDKPSPKPSPSPSPSSIPSPNPSASPSPSPTPSPSPESNSPTPTPTSTPTPTQTPLPSPPSNLEEDGDISCNDSGQLQIKLKWNGVDYATSYKIYRNGAVVSSGSLNNFYTDTIPPPFQSQYLYFIRAVNSAGESVDSTPLNISSISCP